MIHIVSVPYYRGFRSYAEPKSQGTLIRETSKWPSQPSPPIDGVCYEFDEHSRLGKCVPVSYKETRVPVPKGLCAGDMYIDRIPHDDWVKAVQLLDHKNGGINQSFEFSSEESVLAFASALTNKEVVAVRFVYYFNVSNGFDCQRIDYLYKPNE